MSASTTPGYEAFSEELGFLLSSTPPPFIYIQSFEALRTTFTVVDALLHDLSRRPTGVDQPSIHCATVDAASCFTPRLFYEGVIHSLIDWIPEWEDGCSIWMPEESTTVRWNENLDTFVHGLVSAQAYLRLRLSQTNSEKRKGKEPDTEVGRNQNVRLVIVIERAEKLKEDHPELLVPLTRLAELARIDLCVIFISQVGWEDVRPPFGASPDPYFVDVPSLTKENISKLLVTNYPSYASPNDNLLETPYHPALASLYPHFITMLCDVCYPFTHNPDELQYIAAARWPGFVKPLIDEYKQALHERRQEDNEVDLDSELPQINVSEDLRIRLIRYFNASFTTALETLLPRQSNAADWASANVPPDNLFSMARPDTGYQQQQPSAQEALAATSSQAGMRSLPRMSKFLLIASFLASTNPAKSDLRMFGRGLDEKKHRRRGARSSGKTKSGVASKIPQRLLGPIAFPLDRILAILGALLEENDVETRLVAREFVVPGEYTDMEIGRVGVYAAITELTSLGLMHRTSPADRLDGPPMFKAAISYDDALALAKELDIALNDLLWDPV
ncbi:origin recognition complex subunit 5 C-terminus-domain-containing protein [Crepidotus variabilis]|uniref:Origin recognition complex subunit 5 C-terminus-domain-containing protein n=1 Tax=Crepidotus variabilis TaxID=179855 RepID=A0A9P6JT20_9AGAR|nr:origin recognition complex subunit 5 C-terminus-domain-containing protein [Crepidotus variabilis]